MAAYATLCSTCSYNYVYIFITELDEMPKLHQLQRLYRNGTVVNVIRAVAPCWENFALCLEMERNMIDIWKRDTNEVEDAARKLFSHWLDGNGRSPISWRTLIQALREAGLRVIAADVERILIGHSGEISQHSIQIVTKPQYSLNSRTLSIHSVVNDITRPKCMHVHWPRTQCTVYARAANIPSSSSSFHGKLYICLPTCHAYPITIQYNTCMTLYYY